MSDCISFRTLSEKGDKFLHNRTGMINLYFLASLSHWVQSCHLPQEPSTLHNMNSHNSYHICPSLPAALAVMAVEIWLIRSQLLENSIFLDTDSYGRRIFATHLCCWLHVLVEGKERLSFQVGWIFVGLEPCEERTLGVISNAASSCSMKPQGKQGWQAWPASTVPAQVSPQPRSEVRVWQECERQSFSTVRLHFWSGNMADLSGMLAFWRLPESYGMNSCFPKTAGGVLKGSSWNWNRGVWAKARVGGSRWGRCST